MSIVTIIMKTIIIMKIWTDLLAFTASLVACINRIYYFMFMDSD